MSYRRRYRRRYRPAAAPPQDDGCLTGLIVVIVTWAILLLVLGIAIALH
jgi:hypothetical protein